MKMGKKVREYKSGDFIFAKVKGYPAWPARVQRPNGKKYFVYFYGTGETANLPPNMIFDYAENKDKFLNKPVKRRDFNDGVKQIEHDFANNVPLEEVIGIAEPTEGENNTINESANETADDTMEDTTAADETIAEENTTQNDTGIEDSDETGALVIDEGKTPAAQKGRKSTLKTPAKETPKRGRPKKEEKEEEDAKEAKEDEKKEEEIVSRSGRKIRPKRYIDEQTEENTTLPSPAPKKRRGGSPGVEKEKEKAEPAKGKADKNLKQFNAVSQFELEDLKEPFQPEDAEKDNIIITCLPSGQYIGVKLFQSRPSSFKNISARLKWDRQAVANALKLKTQLERGQITPQSVQGQLEMELNLTDEEKTTLDKERETEEKKSRVQFLKTEMKLIELDTKIKTCLCLEKADTELCLKLMDEFSAIDLKPLMLMKHPSCVETIKRMRAYVGNTPSWDLSTADAIAFSQRAKQIRESADNMYHHMKELFTKPEGLSFWEFFSERVLQFKKVTEKLTADELLELVHEPLEMTVPSSHTMRSSIEVANEVNNEEEESVKKKITPSTPAKSKKTNSTPAKVPVKRQSSRKQQEEKDKESKEETNENKEQTNEEEKDIDYEKDSTAKKDKDHNEKESKDTEKDAEEKDENETLINKDSEQTDTNSKENHEEMKEPEEEQQKEDKSESKDQKEKDKKEGKEKNESKDKKEPKDKNETKNKNGGKDKNANKDSSEGKDKIESKEKSESKDKEKEKGESKDRKREKEDEKDKNEDEPRAKRSRESKKTEPAPPRSPTKRKSKPT